VGEVRRRGSNLLVEYSRAPPISISAQMKVAVIAGAGPAGLTAALELLKSNQVMPLVFEADAQVGGISKTVNYLGNRMDLGGHRFFSKSDWVMRWWQEILPISQDCLATDAQLRISYQNQSRTLTREDSASSTAGAVMLVRQRMSRIFYRRRFFDYPLKLNAVTFRNIGLMETLRIGMSYSRSKVMQRYPELNLEDFLLNRFGNRLYRTFFKDYTEKVWGVPCREISAEWGAQRIKGLSVSKALAHALLSPFRSATDVAQKSTDTSLIERFLYPRLGPGQMWEEVAKRVEANGGSIRTQQRVVGLELSGNEVRAVKVRDEKRGDLATIPCDFLISTVPIKELTEMLGPSDADVLRIAQNLPYRDFMTVGLLVKKMCHGMPPDNWIYIQEPDVKIGRLQIFNNWSPALVADPSTIWLGLEYFCTEGDELWSQPDARFIDFATAELEKIGLIDRADVVDGTVVRVSKAYPAYFGEYGEFEKVRQFLDEFPNLYAIGRNGMHRYNNQDHSMLAAKGAVDAILNDGVGKSAIWNINADSNYHEEASE
jgi:protoporphyrinogen oxidase